MKASRLCANLFRHKAFEPIVEEGIASSDEVLCDGDALDDWAKREVIAAHHVSSTCKMGPSDDPMAVVRQYGRVHGIDGLRIVDASILPDTVRANLNPDRYGHGGADGRFHQDGMTIPDVARPIRTQ